MTQEITIYNTLTRRKEKFEPINPPFVGLYSCGPTVYSDPHLGHARQAITYDIIYRYLTLLGYKVRYVRNITDVGHLEDEVSGEGEDRIAKKARLEQLEPMEIAQRYVNRYHQFLEMLNNIPPGIEPRASGHIIEQQQLIKMILENGYGYVVNGSVYFDVEKYDKDFDYGILSGRKIEELLSNTRELEGQSEKRNNLDFALWKKASAAHIMKWPSEWSEGFPGWHLECSAMSNKYLGETFDIHGGGMDLLFPHHECEIAQSTAAYGKSSVKYWVHNNMITIKGQKMARSLNNFITLEELFTGNHKLLESSYSPMTLRFFILQAHYRSTLDFSNEALQAAGKGLGRLTSAMKVLENLSVKDSAGDYFSKLEQKCYEAMNDDFNCPVLISHLFDGARQIFAAKDGSEAISENEKRKAIQLYDTFVKKILGLKVEEEGSRSGVQDSLIDLLLHYRLEAKKNKDFATADKIRNDLTKLGISIKDTKDGFEWEYA